VNVISEIEQEIYQLYLEDTQFKLSKIGLKQQRKKRRKQRYKDEINRMCDRYDEECGEIKILKTEEEI
jgi:hypothetical protein